MKPEYLADLALIFGLIALALLCGWLGYQLGQRDLAVLRAQHASEQLAAANEAATRLADAQHHADVLTINLARARAESDRLALELKNEIPSVTDGRACLREPALRVLDRAPGLSVHMPESARSAAAADADRVATDTQLGSWAIESGAQYAECSRRLRALIDWHAGPHAVRRDESGN